MSNEPKSSVYVPPVIEHSEWDDTPERVELFSITRPAPTDDDPEAVEEVGYSIPGKPHVGLGLAYLRMARIQGVTMAMAWLVEEAVGYEGFAALTAEPDLTPEQFGQIFNRVQTVVLGGLDGPKD